MKPELYTTFRRLRQAGACVARYRHLAKALGGVNQYGMNTPITLNRLMEINGVVDGYWVVWAADLGSMPKRDTSRAERVVRMVYSSLEPLEECVPKALEEERAT